MKDYSLYAVTFKYNNKTFVMTYYEWRLGKYGWSSPRYTFVPTSKTSFDKIKLFISFEKAKSTANDLFCWDNGADCDTMDYISKYETDITGKIDLNKVIYKVKRSDIKIKRIVYEYDHCEDVS